MQKLDFNKDWTCRCLTREEKAYPVTLPHDAMLGEPRTEESLGEGNTGWYLGGDYEYRKYFEVPEDYRAKTVLIEFEGVYHNAEVYLNGKKAAYHPYGYTGFYVDTRGFLNYGGQNEIRVVACNSDQPNSRWYSGTGIYRPVTLHVGGEKHIPVNGVKIRTVSIEPTAVIEVEVATSVPGEVVIAIAEGDKTVTEKNVPVGEKPAVISLEVPGAKLWSCEKPNLYTCRVTFGEDTVTETFGIRKLDYNSREGLTINGKRVILRGACIHHDNGVLGACAFPEAEERKVRIMKENGYNALRSAHNPCSKALLEACDRLGMLMMDEYVDVWYIHKTEHDYADFMTDWWERDLKAMVEKDYNHPSVIMYSTGNEVSETAQKKGIDLTGVMTRHLHSLDGTRPVTCGINIFFNFLSSVGFGVYSDEKAKKNAEDAEKKKKEAQQKKENKKPVGSEFYNTLACALGDYTMKIGATLPPCDWKTKEAFANMDVAGYNYGLFRYRHDLRKYPDRLILGSETFCKDAYKFWEIARNNPRIIGDFVWAGWDYIGETGDGAAEFRDYLDTCPAARMTGGNGRIDLIGKPRAEAAFTRVAFEQDKGPFIAVLPVYEKEKLHITGWQLTKALESWSWRGCAGEEALVEVYARAAEVELLINEKSVGRKALKSTCRAVFRTTYEDGDITAVSYDKKGREIGRRTLTTAGEKTVLAVTPETERIRPWRSTA
jgi:beta-galactosidase